MSDTMRDDSKATPGEADKALLAALGRIPSGLFVLTFRQGKHETAMLASWVQQCSFEPPQVAFAINEKRYVLDWLVEGSPVTVNILGEGQKELVSHFGKGFEPGVSAFDAIKIEHSGTSARDPHGCPCLPRLPSGAEAFRRRSYLSCSKRDCRPNSARRQAGRSRPP